MSNTLARYAFLPWLRRGIAAKIKEDDNFNNFTSPPTGGWSLERPEFKLKVKITGTKGGASGTETVEQDISLIGPGDVLGIDQNVVIKHDPADWITNYEPNYFPYIEFYEEDFPWRYSPAKPVGDKLRPWLMLVVLKEEEFKREEGFTGPLPSIQVFPHATDTVTNGAESSVWPDPSETWAWAHVHMSGDLDASNNLDPSVSTDMQQALNRFIDVVGSDPDRGVSRIICPRKLEANTNYHAFLVPTFEAGRLAGLGADAARLATVRAQDPAFGVAHASDAFTDRWPYYYSWYFKTGVAGDFEEMVRRIVPRPCDPSVGKRDMDMQDPGYNVGYGTDPIPFDGTLELEGALVANDTREAYPWTSSNTYRDRLADLINLSEDLMEATFPPSQFYGSNPFGYVNNPSSPIEDDPIVTPDIYGRWHNLKKRVNTTYTSWIHELNLDPRNRAVAGLGAKYVRQNQDDLMDKAWEQLGDVIEANRKLNWGQFSAQVSAAGYAKHLVNQPAEQAMSMVGGVLKRVSFGSLTAYSKVRESALPMAMESSTFRRVQRPNGPVMKRIDPTNTVFTQNNMRVDVGSNSLAVVPAKAVSTQQSFLGANNTATYVNSVISFSPSATPMFGVSAPGGAMIPNLAQESAFQAAVSGYQNILEPTNWVGVSPQPSLDVAATATAVVDTLNPRLAISKRAYHLVTSPEMTQPAPDRIVPVMAYPVFQNPMYEAVKDLGVEFLIPNLDLIPNNSITLVQTNQRFVESFLVGANHEMGRELLWREYPTDQRGSYFRQFWDSADTVNTANDPEDVLAESIIDIEEIHLWNNSLLGQNNARPGISDPNSLVLVVRGDLLKKFPNVVIYAQAAKWKAGDTNYTQARELDETATPLYPVFGAKVEPDVHFLAFNLTEDDARGSREITSPDPGYFFVIMERPGEIRFGVDLPIDPPVAFQHWDDLSQDTANFVGQHLSTTTPPNNPTVDLKINGDPSNLNPDVIWGENSTNFAQILFQNPVMVCIHAHEMLPNS